MKRSGTEQNDISNGTEQNDISNGTEQNDISTEQNGVIFEISTNYFYLNKIEILIVWVLTKLTNLNGESFQGFFLRFYSNIGSWLGLLQTGMSEISEQDEINEKNQYGVE